MTIANIERCSCARGSTRHVPASRGVDAVAKRVKELENDSMHSTFFGAGYKDGIRFAIRETRDDIFKIIAKHYCGLATAEQTIKALDDYRKEMDKLTEGK